MDVSGDRASESVEVVSYYLSRNQPGNRMTSSSLQKREPVRWVAYLTGFFVFMLHRYCSFLH